MGLTEQQLARKMAWLEKQMEEGSRPASRVTSAGAVFGGRNPFEQHGDGEWPVEKLKALGDAYHFPAAMQLYGMRKGRPRITGIGPSLVALCAMSGNQDAIAIAKSQGLFDDNFGTEQFERRHGYVTVAKAKTHGIKQLNGEVRKVALADGSGMSGGYVVPPQFMNELLTIAAEDAFIEARAKVIPMNSRTVQWPMLDITTAQATGTSPYFGGILAQWQPEAATINETEPAFRQSEWTAWDLVLYTVSSNQLLMDNGIGLDALLTQLFGAAITWYKEYAYLQGLGAGATMPLGILNAPATYLQNRGTPSTFKLADAAAMMAHLQIQSWDDACWIMHQSVIPQLIQMVDNATSNRLVWMSPMGDGSSMGPAAMKLPKAFLNGLPIFFTEKVPTLGTRGDVMLVDWSRYVIGMRLDLQIDVSNQYLFRNNQLAWRVIARGDGRPWLSSVITDQAGWVSSPFVALN